MEDETMNHRENLARWRAYQEQMAHNNDAAEDSDGATTDTEDAVCGGSENGSPETDTDD